MRFSYAESMTDPAYYAALAQAAEEAGYDSFLVADSICYPKESASSYPFSPDGSREFLEDRPFVDPFVLIGALGALTSRIRFVTFVLKLPVRNPVLVAKQVTSAAALYPGRLALGVGASPWREDYEYGGVPWAGRGRRMDEAMEIVRGYGTGDWFSYQGRVFSLPAAKMSPVPAEQVPILVGGHSEAALRRAAMLGDGWLHGGGDAEELAHLLDRLRKIRHELSEQSGDIPRPSGDIPRGEREPAPETTEPEAGEFSSQTGGQEAAGAPRMPFEVHVISPDAFSVDGVRRLEEMGVTDVSVGFRWPYSPGPDRQSLTEKLDALRRYADDVISKVKP